MRSTLTCRLHTSLFPGPETHVSLPKASQTPLPWNQTPHLTQILAPPISLNVLLTTLLFTQIPAENIDMYSASHQILGSFLSLSAPRVLIGSHLNSWNDLKYHLQIYLLRTTRIVLQIYIPKQDSDLSLSVTMIHNLAPVHFPNPVLNTCFHLLHTLAILDYLKHTKWNQVSQASMPLPRMCPPPGTGAFLSPCLFDQQVNPTLL